MKPTETSTHQKCIAVYRTAALGDFVMTIPALNKVREYFPDHRVIFLTSHSSGKAQKKLVANYIENDYPEWVDLLSPGVIDDVICISNTSSVTEAIKLKKILAPHHIERVICMVDVCSPLFNRIKKFMYLKFLFPKSPIFGLNAPGFRFNSNHLKLREKGLLPHHIYGPMQFIEDMGLGFLKNQNIYFNIRSTTESINKVDDLIHKVINKNLLCISFGAIKPHKRWPSENFLILIDMIHSQFPDYKIILTGTKTEESTAQIFIKNRPYIINLVGKLNIKELAALFKSVPVLISNDGGAAHLADACGAKVITITPGIELQDSIEPFFSKHLSIRSYPKCYPCYDFNDCKLGTYECINNIMPIDVFHLLYDTINQIDNNLAY